MGWTKSFVRQYQKVFVAEEKEPECLIIDESQDGFWRGKLKITLNKQSWEEIGKVMGWK